MPYARLTVLGSKPTLTTGAGFIEVFTFSLAFYGTDQDALYAIADTIQAELDQAYPNAASLICTRLNKVYSTEIENGVYNYVVTLDYEWSYNTTST